MIDSAKLTMWYSDNAWTVTTTVEGYSMVAPRDGLVVTIDAYKIALSQGNSEWTLGYWNDKTARYHLWNRTAVRSDEMTRLLLELARTPDLFLRRLHGK